MIDQGPIRGALSLLFLCAGLAGAGCRRQAPPPPPPQPKVMLSEPAHLDKEQQAYLFDIEHHGLLLARHGFQPLADALRDADEAGLRRLLAADFVGQVPGAPSETRLAAPFAQVVRQGDAGQPPQSLDGTAFVGRLLSYRRAFTSPPQVRLTLGRLAPVTRERPDEPWQGTAQLRMWGEQGKGQPGEAVLDLQFRVPRPSADHLGGGWLRACAITQSLVGHAPRFLFRDVTAARGLDPRSLYDTWETDFRGQTGGVYVADYNRDGILDVLITDLSATTLYQGLPGGRFRDVTRQMGLVTRINGTAAAFADLDGDGFEDLIFADRIFHNDDGQLFVDVTRNSNLSFLIGKALRQRGMAPMIAGDFDRDGRVDLYVMRPAHTRPDSWLNGRGNRGGGVLLRNLGDWKFADVTAAAGVDYVGRWAYTGAWLDADNDGWPDLYLINNFGNGVLFVNQRNGTFREHALSQGPADFSSLGLAAGDVDNDGNIDLYVANLYSPAGQRIIGNMRPASYRPSLMATIRQLAEGSQLYLNRGGLNFVPAGKAMHVADIGWAHGATLADLDNDGFLDLYATSGYASRTRDEPDGAIFWWIAVVSQPAQRGTALPAPGKPDESLKEFWVEDAAEIVRQGHNLGAYERKRTFLNLQGRDFIDVSYLSGADNEGDGRAVVAADLRNTGRLDLLERNAGGGPLTLYENQLPQRHYLEVSLHGKQSNRLGIGARLVATAAGRQLVRELYPANTNLSQAPALVHFGLGDAQRVDRLQVRWPSGKVQEFTALAADRHVVIDEGTEGPAAVKTVVPGKRF